MGRKKKRPSKGLLKYIQRQKLIIKRMAKDEAEAQRLTKELLDRFYKEK